MKKMKRIGSLVLAGAMMFGTLQTGVLATEVQTSAEQTAVQTITCFVQGAKEIAEVSFEQGQDVSELTANMPDTIEVYLNGTQDLVEIPVTWECLGDYEGEEYYYYQFNPVWDESAYELDPGLDALTDVPYVTARRASTSTSSDNLISQKTANANAYTIFDFLVEDIGYNAAAACGVLANIAAESNFNPNATGDSGSSYGICQWHNTRWTAMKTWCNENGYDWTTLTGQLNYLKKELSANNSDYLYNGKTIDTKMKSFDNTASGAYDAGYYWCCYYEVPANKESVGATRGNAAQNTYWPEFKDISVSGDSDQTVDDGTVASVFKDISKSAWYFSAVQFVYDEGIMAGTSKTTFEPNASMTRAMSAQILKNLSDSDSENFGLTASNSSAFSDVSSSAWYASAVSWAAGAGIVNGYDDGTFGPLDEVTREQFACFLYSYATQLGYDVSATTSLTGFSDSDAISDWALDAMQWVVAEGIMSGSDGALMPQDSLTRAQAASLIQKFVDVLA